MVDTVVVLVAVILLPVLIDQVEFMEVELVTMVDMVEMNFVVIVDMVLVVMEVLGWILH